MEAVGSDIENLIPPLNVVSNCVVLPTTLQKIGVVTKSGDVNFIYEPAKLLDANHGRIP